jgi:hypothetical protein
MPLSTRLKTALIACGVFAGLFSFSDSADARHRMRRGAFCCDSYVVGDVCCTGAVDSCIGGADSCIGSTYDYGMSSYCCDDFGGRRRARRCRGMRRGGCCATVCCQPTCCVSDCSPCHVGRRAGRRCRVRGGRRMRGWTYCGVVDQGCCNTACAAPACAAPACAAPAYVAATCAAPAVCAAPAPCHVSCCDSHIGGRRARRCGGRRARRGAVCCSVDYCSTSACCGPTHCGRRGLRGRRARRLCCDTGYAGYGYGYGAVGCSVDGVYAPADLPTHSAVSPVVEPPMPPAVEN